MKNFTYYGKLYLASLMMCGICNRHGHESNLVFFAKRLFYTCICSVCFSCLCFLSCFKASAQQAVGTNNRESELRTLLNSQFTQIVTGGSVSSFGNYAALSSTNESVKVSGSFVGKNADVFSLELSGGASDGIFSIFNGGKVNSNLGFGITYNKLLMKPQTSISRDALARDEFDKEQNEVELAFEKRMREIRSRSDLATLYEKKIKLIDELNKLDASYKDIDCGKDVLKIPTDRTEAEALILRSSICSKKGELRDIRSKISKIEEDVDAYFDTQELNASNQRNRKNREITEKIKNMTPTRLNISWISIGYRYNKNNFNLFDGTKPFEEQVIKTSFASEEFFATFSHFVSEPGAVQRYISYGLKYAMANNLEELSKKEVQDIVPAGDSSVRSTIEKKTVYMGDYKYDIGRFTIFLDSYFFVGNKSNLNLAIHLNPQLVKIGNSNPVTSLKIGLFAPFKDSKKAGSIVNLEVFLKLNNIFRRSPGSESVISNNSFGIQTTFPLGFITTFNK